MPTYEYACKSCSERLEVVQSFSDDPLTECPACDDGELRKVFSAAGIIFKGDGWHIKDYASKGASSTTASTSSSTSGDSSSASSDSSSPSSDSSSAGGASTASAAASD